mmetsp:Transcript_32131/g.86058  ORF Transcript_32131/g.86058 Transcript_32131/m.86058 type:complete len:97 (+) Transcript_32131:78-368(+)
MSPSMQEESQKQTVVEKIPKSKREWVFSSVLVICTQRTSRSSLLDAKHKLKIVCSASGCTPLERTFAASGRNGNNPRRCCARLVEGDKGCAGTFSR